jgi:Protein of unknown function (DUF4232)
MLTRTARRAIPAVVLVAAGLTLAACGPDDSSSSASASSSASTTSSATTGTSDATDTPTSAPTSASSSAGTIESKDTSASGSIAGCATRNLKTTTANSSSGAGHTTFQLVFQNTGSAPCTLRGYPGVSFVKIHNIQLGKAASHTGGSITDVTLIPNAHAYADVQSVNGPGGYSAARCDLTNVPTLRVYPPNQTESTNIPWNTKECVGSSVQNLQVGPVHSNR